MSKQLHTGHAAWAGLSGRFARESRLYGAAPHPRGGAWILRRDVSADADASAVMRPQDNWLIHDTSFKPVARLPSHPSCHRLRPRATRSGRRRPAGFRGGGRRNLRRRDRHLRPQPAGKPHRSQVLAAVLRRRGGGAGSAAAGSFRRGVPLQPGADSRRAARDAATRAGHRPGVSGALRRQGPARAARRTLHEPCRGRCARRSGAPAVDPGGTGQGRRTLRLTARSPKAGRAQHSPQPPISAGASEADLRAPFPAALLAPLF